jgi:DNA adenine methylase
MCSPISVPGGKSHAVPTLMSVLQKHFSKPSLLISPFFGGGSFEFSVHKMWDVSVHGNDIDDRLINFWRTLQHHQTKFVAKVKSLPPITKEIFDQARARLLSKRKQSDMSRAIDFYILNRTSFAALGMSGGYSVTMAERMAKRDFTPLSQFDLSGITFHHGHWKTFLIRELKNRPANAVIFLDPPYYFERVTRMYGKNGDLCLEFNHEELRDYLATKRGWMMSYNNVPYVHELYQDIPGVLIYECRWSYSMCASSKDKNNGKRWPELVIVRPFERSKPSTQAKLSTGGR